MKTKAYITLIDRNWKGKEWFTSYRSYKNIRRLTDEEAKLFLADKTIEEVPPVIYEKILGVDDGRIYCLKCGSRKGMYIKKRPFGHNLEIYTCANCGRKEKSKL